MMPDLNNVPSKGTVLGLLGATSLVGVLFFIDPKLAGIVVFGLMVVALLTAKLVFLRAWLKKRKAQKMASELGENSGSKPAAISEKPQVERLDGLRKNFLGGLEKFKAAGKDLYKLPWYVIVGEPGAGKTEVIRHCDVGFPPGMQEEEFMGVGGTINMNWWFTNRAVILDTAGRLLFEKVPAGSTGEWKEFLKLLRKHRPNCPINGLLLAIPADSLIKDPLKKVEERAGWIAKQLEGIQRELDIRFPVYVIITKCDLLNGFREFFKDMDDAESQRQMLGWSNPDPLDTPYRPELVEEHMLTVVERLRNMRLRLLEDPVARDPAGRRVDEMDQPYAFPNSVMLIGQNLRTYLSTIFVANEWVTKPAFLRGIYFTSSLQEGSELDQELAEVIGVSVDELPAGGAWKRESTYFLRDLFLEKIFPEWGLVTRASNTRRVVRQRQMAVLGTAAAALAVSMFFALVGYSSMKQSIGRQSGYWLRASEGWQPENTWMPIVTTGQDGGYTYHGDEVVGSGTMTSTRELFTGASQPLVDFHGTLRELTEQPINIAAVFRPFARIAGNFDAERKWAQRIVLEGSVIKPVLDTARDKISNGGSPTEMDKEREALIALVRIEAGIVKRMNGNTEIAAPADLMNQLFGYTTGGHSEYDASVPDVIAWTYSTGDGGNKWPEQWMSGGGTLQSSAPDYNKAIDVGIDHFEKNCSGQFDGLRAQMDMLAKLLAFIRDDYEKKEAALWQMAGGPVGGPIQDQQLALLKDRYDDFRDHDVAPLDQMMDQAVKARLFTGDSVSLLKAYQRLHADWAKLTATQVASVDAMLAEATFAETKTRQQSMLMKEIRQKLEGVKSRMQQGEPEDLNEGDLKAADVECLTDAATNHLSYKERADDYLSSLATTLMPAPSGPWVGTKFQAIEVVKAQIDNARRNVYAYGGANTQEFRTLCDCWLSYAESHQIDECWTAYLAEAKPEVAEVLHYPLVLPMEDETALAGPDVLRAAELIRKIDGDLNSKTFTERPAQQVESVACRALETFRHNVARLDPVINGLVVPEENRIARFKIYLRPGPPRAVAVGMDPNQVAGTTMPSLMYELRNGDWNWKKEHKSLSRKISIDASAGASGEVLMMEDSLDKVFHAHFWFGTGRNDYKEVKCGPNWTALRLLITKNASSNDDVHWGLNMKEDTGDYPLNLDVYLEIDFERPIPGDSAWPSKGQVLSED